MASTQVDKSAVTFSDDGLVRVDGIAVFRKVIYNGELHIEFFDHDRLRSKCRGTKFVTIPLAVLVSMVDAKAGLDGYSSR